MNSYTVNSMIVDGGKTQSVSLLYAILPIIFGISIDLLFTQIMGSQYCSLNELEYTCTIHGIHIPQWQREVIRFTLQFGLIMCVFMLLQKFTPGTVIPMYNSLYGIIGVVLYFLVQPDLFSDFRRLINGALFTLKYN